jgi:hypothetical protein
MMPMTATTKMNLMANQMIPATKCSRAKATSAAITPPPINSTRSKVLRPDRSSLTANNAIPPLAKAIGALQAPWTHPLGGTVR